MKTLTKQELRKMMDMNQDFVLINVLPRDSFDQEHIPGSINCPLGDEDFEKKIIDNIPDKNKRIVAYCASFECQASNRAAERLVRLGYTDVCDYEGGIKDWKNTGYSLETMR